MDRIAAGDPAAHPPPARPLPDEGREATPEDYAVAPDGEHFLMVRHEPEAIPDRINIVLNWFEEINRLCPVR